jgi:hypothetical protein
MKNEDKRWPMSCPIRTVITRGTRFVLFGSNFIAHVAGWFDVTYGWRWTMHFGAMISAVAAVIPFLFMEETIYFRQTVEGEELDVTTPADITPAEKTVINPDSQPEKDNQTNTVTSSPAIFAVPSYPPPKTYWQMFTMMYRPLLIMLYFPCTDWAGFLYGICLSWPTC